MTKRDRKLAGGALLVGGGFTVRGSVTARVRVGVRAWVAVGVRLGGRLLARMMQCSSSDSEKISPPASYAMVLK